MMKKTLFIILIGVLLLSFNSCGKKGGDAPASPTEGDAQQAGASDSGGFSLELDTESPADVSLSTAIATDTEIETYIKKLVNSYNGATMDTLTVMSATDGTGGYKVHAMITWNKKMNTQDSRKTLETYSATIASMVNANLENVQKLNLVWLVPNLDGRGKFTYKRVDGMLSLSEISFDSQFGGITPLANGASSTTEGGVDTAATDGLPADSEEGEEQEQGQQNE